ncbi:hypothetical protein CO058_01180 [candidate division WWE3 bacterium CG_4_9_14_0_2_um_filter_35_11]|uniref:Pilus assembly protein PilO n=1 Tax=candidate division WWE3 bacterium CG_4_9_14_0_2_um_filter_35_11 TaxID=1975077 RepID=A0A2M8EM88_UNCKA|nr:MAG: hypothetical protein COV25_03000 [candidate division WWE3 bacterium CG10_big_fil_rev_8_21_14_0_10_35_32]PJC23853.1 MAG: hypothetical protein CO058_01180 [candidate division WWE3 bacterium CG_4_9_14_0_2_um_filter_35_11]
MSNETENKNPGKVKNIKVESLSFVKKVLPFVSIIGLLFAIFLLFYLLIIPQYRSYKQLVLDLESENLKFTEVEQRLNYLQSLYDLKDQLASNIQLAIESIPDNKDKIPNSLDQLLQIAIITGVNVDSQSLVGIVVTDDPLKPKMVKIQMQLSGDKQKLIDFIKTIGENRTIIDVENFSLDKIEEKTTNTDGAEVLVSGFNLRLNLITYYFEGSEGSTEAETQKPFTELDEVLSEISGMKYYEQRQSEVIIGKQDPFVDVPIIKDNGIPAVVVEENIGIVPQ